MKLTVKRTRALAARFDTFTLIRLSKLPAQLLARLLVEYDVAQMAPRRRDWIEARE